jgi:hypothetical protein
MLSWSPAYKKIILDVGDERVSHSGGKGGLIMSQLHSSEVEELELPKEIRSSIEKILKDFDTDKESDEPHPDDI